MGVRGRANLEGVTTDVIPKLSDREQQCLEGISSGLTDREIGAKVYLSEHTIKIYLGRVYDKLGARNRSHAVALAHQMGLL